MFFVLFFSFLVYICYLFIYKKFQLFFLGSEKKELSSVGFLSKNIVFGFELFILLLLFLFFDSIFFGHEDFFVTKITLIWSLMFVLILDDCVLFEKEQQKND